MRISYYDWLFFSFLNSTYTFSKKHAEATSQPVAAFEFPLIEILPRVLH